MSDSPRVAPHLLDASMFWNPSGGVHRYLSAKRRFIETEKPGWHHTIAVPTPDQRDQLCIPALLLPGSGGSYRLPWRRAATARLLVRARPTLIESADPYRTAWAALDAAQALDIPAVAFCHSNLERLAHAAAGKLAARAARRYAAHLYRQFDLVLAPSHAMTSHLRDWGVERVQRQPLGVDSALFHPSRASPAWRDALGLPAGTRLLVYVGRFAPEKNLGVLVEAVHRLGRGYRLLAIGAGPAPISADDLILVRPVLRDAVQLATAIASCDAFVHAGDQETFGLSVLEALACGTPVVARAAEGLAELVDDRVGCAVPSSRARDFAAAIEAVCNAERSPLSVAARARAADEYDWQRVLEGLWQRYDRLSMHARVPA